MGTEKPPGIAFREALEGRSFWRDAVLNDPELGFIMLDEAGTVLSINDNAADILLAVTADRLLGRRLDEVFPEGIARERVEFIAHVQASERPLLVTSLFRGVRCRCVFRRLPGDAGAAGHTLWTTRRAPIPWEPAELHAMIDVVDAQELDWGLLAGLTDEERTIFKILASGAAPQEAAARLELPLESILRIRRFISETLGTECPIRLAHYAIAAGLILPEPLLMVHA